MYNSNICINLPKIKKHSVEESENNKYSDDYEEDFEEISEEVKDLNTSQTGKGSSQEEKSHSSNFAKDQQTAGSHSDEKVNSKNTNDDPQPQIQKSKGKSSAGSKRSKDEEKKNWEEEKETIDQQADPMFPLIARPSPISFSAKERLIQTADSKRMPMISMKFRGSSVDSTNRSNSNDEREFSRDMTEMRKPTSNRNSTSQPKVKSINKRWVRNISLFLIVSKI